MTTQVVEIPHFVRGRTVEGGEVSFVSRDRATEFRSPTLKLDDLVWPRPETPPLYGVPMREILDFLVEAGRRMDLDTNDRLKASFEATVAVNLLSARVLEHFYRVLPAMFDRDRMEAEYRNALGDDYDSWKRFDTPDGAVQVRACPARMVHVLAGNNPGVSAQSIRQSALARGVSLFKVPSNDVGTAQALLGTLADIDATHPVTQSFAAAYWKGGDSAVEGVLYRPQFFDKIVAWGGDAAIRNLQKYVGPGLELVSMDPKVSISLIGAEAFESPQQLADVAERAARDVGNQEACTSSRYQFVEGTVEQVDEYCAALLGRLAIDRPHADAIGHAPPADVREGVDGLRYLEPEYRVWGDYSGAGLVVRSPEPVDFHPIGKTVNVVSVRSLADAVQFAGVSTQTVGCYPPERKSEVLDLLAAAGIQRFVPLGDASPARKPFAKPHDGMWVLARMVRWVVDETDAPDSRTVSGE